MYRTKTLDKVWEKCLDDWKKITDYAYKNDTRDVIHIKMKLYITCEFCIYTRSCRNLDAKDLKGCPGKLVDKDFHCMNHPYYDYRSEPFEFYKKIQSLYEQYKLLPYKQEIEK